MTRRFLTMLVSSVSAILFFVAIPGERPQAETPQAETPQAETPQAETPTIQPAGQISILLPGEGDRLIAQGPDPVVAAYEAQISALQSQIAELSTRIATAEAYNEELHQIRDGLPPVDEWTPTHAMIYNTLTTQIFDNYNLVIELRQERYEAETALAAAQAALAAYLGG